MLNSDKESTVTTMIDLYGLKGEYPGYKAAKQKAPHAKVEAIESEIAKDILASKYLHNHRFIPYFQLHEFEALLFSDPGVLEAWLGLDRDLPKNCFFEILDQFDSPEHINDNPQTAPSKRILGIAHFYQKINEGVLIVEEIGLARIRGNVVILMVG